MQSKEEFMEQVEKIFSFHKRRAPGIVIALAMFQIAIDKIGPLEKLNAYAETDKCLPDVLQFMLGATIGNGDLKMNLTGRYAMSIVNTKSKKGVRVYVDVNKIDPDKTPTLHKFFMRQRGEKVLTDKSYRKESNLNVINEFLSTDRVSIFGVQEIIPLNTDKPPVDSAVICEKCDESFTTPTPDIKVCPHCNGQAAYYKLS